MRFSNSVARGAALLAVAAGMSGVGEAQQAGRRLGLDALSGPGLVIEVRDDLRAGASKDGASPGLVHDYELQHLVQELRAAKARGIAINGVRLNEKTSIRAIGPRIHIGLQPVDAPYKVEAVGDPASLRQALERPGGLISRVGDAGPDVRVERAERVRLLSTHRVYAFTTQPWKAQLIFRAGGETITLPLVSRRLWDSRVRSDTTRQLKDRGVHTGNVRIDFVGDTEDVTVTADAMSYPTKLPGGPVALFTLTGNVVFTAHVDGKPVIRRTADKATFDMRA